MVRKSQFRGNIRRYLYQTSSLEKHFHNHDTHRGDSGRAWGVLLAVSRCIPKQAAKFHITGVVCTGFAINELDRQAHHEA